MRDWTRPRRHGNLRGNGPIPAGDEMPKLTPPALNHVCDLFVELDPIREMGAGRAGQRRIVPIVGGRVAGPRLEGRILNLGADWQTIFADGLAELDTRYAIETTDGALIEIVNYGYRHGPDGVIAAIARGETVDPGSYYMRTHARLETGDARYAWVNRTLFVGTGARLDGQVIVSLFALE
ncbi:DUF3237 domain-containing protein [Sulfitobacter sp. LCG007]